jgi:proteasome lid subunit RPN8/RPN11
MTVIIPKEAYLTIVAASVRYANKRMNKDDWLEVYGVFIGKNKGNDVLISAAYPITHQEKRPEDVIDKVYWSPEDYVSFGIIDDAAFANGEFTVGWWHSHPGHKVMMTQLDVKTTLAYQTNNSMAISLVFNPERLDRQIEKPEKKGDPEIQLKEDPGFKIFRLDDVSRGIEASYHTIDFIIEGYESMEQLVKLTQKFTVDITNMFPSKNLFETYDKFINDKINDLNSVLQGTEEYLETLSRRGESYRINEVLANQTKEIRRNVAETFIKIENIKQFLNYLEFKERDTIIPRTEQILVQWDETVANLNNRLTNIAKKF